MKLLLDTHVAIWATASRNKIPAAILDLIADEVNEVHVSVVSIWEIAIKFKLRQHSFPYSAEEAARRFAEARFGILDVNSPHALAVSDLALHHHDPFDRMMVAQSIVEGMRFVSRDSEVAKYGPSILSF